MGHLFDTAESMPKTLAQGGRVDMSFIKDITDILAKYGWEIYEQSDDSIILKPIQHPTADAVKSVSEDFMNKPTGWDEVKALIPEWMKKDMK